MRGSGPRRSQWLDRLSVARARPSLRFPSQRSAISNDRHPTVEANGFTEKKASLEGLAALSREGQDVRHRRWLSQSIFQWLFPIKYENFAPANPEKFNA